MAVYGKDGPFPMFPQDVITTETKRLERVCSVEHVHVVIAKLNEVKLIVTAYGYTRTSGWTQPTLKLSNSPSDPVLTFDFLAEPPGPASDALTPIAAGWIGRFEGNSAIQVNAETNSVEEKITDTTTRYKAAAAA